MAHGGSRQWGMAHGEDSQMHAQYDDAMMSNAPSPTAPMPCMPDAHVLNLLFIAIIINGKDTTDATVAPRGRRPRQCRCRVRFPRFFVPRLLMGDA